MSYDTDQEASRPSSSSKGLRRGSSVISTIITAPKGPLVPLKGQPLSVRFMEPISTTSPIREDCELEHNLMEDTNSFDQQPQNRTYTSGKPSFVWPFRKPGSLNSKITNQSPTNEQSHTLVGASEFRPLGRGGSGARSRKASRSNAVVLESNVPHQPPEAGPCRPFGRGGYGSLAKRPLTPSNPPTAILDLLRGHEAPSPIRAQSRFPRIRCHIQKDCYISRDYPDNTHSASASSEFEGLGSSVSRNTDSDDNDDINSYIEETIFPSPNERRQLSISKLTRTLGPLIMEDRQSSQSSVAFNNFPKQGSKTVPTRITILTHSNLSDKFIRPKPSYSSSTVDLHQLDCADDSPKLWIRDNLSRSSLESDTHSPITFAPPSPGGTHPKPIPAPVSGVNTNVTHSHS